MPLFVTSHLLIGRWVAFVVPGFCNLVEFVKMKIVGGDRKEGDGGNIHRRFTIGMTYFIGKLRIK
jgi:hypothetical protein